MQRPSNRAGAIAEIAIFGAGVAMLLGGIAAALGAGTVVAELLYYTAALTVVGLGLLRGTQSSDSRPALTDGGTSVRQRLERWLRQRRTR